MNNQEIGGANQGSGGANQHSGGVTQDTVIGMGHKDDEVVTDEVNIDVSEGVSGIGLKQTVDEVEKVMDEILQGGYVEGNVEVSQVGANEDEGNVQISQVEVSQVRANEDEGNVQISQVEVSQVGANEDEALITIQRNSIPITFINIQRNLITKKDSSPLIRI
ncbi:hypothetical protein L2E82_36022 [Cichorium intybus]|uniref:Uncharacterized protein n=1 Tax=Cichorium intybus TaxID=13427 RepID=A0ACB9BQE4_CICIN|nr:hypothetical protein L2E82_36022 [Cichorium intybus]